MPRVFSQEDGNLDTTPLTTTRTKTYKDIDLTFTARTLGDLFKKTDAAAVKQAVKNLLLTNHGDKPFDPIFGGDLNSFLFENMEDIDEIEIQDQIVTALNNYEPRALVQNVRVHLLPDNNSIQIRVTFRVVNTFEEVELNVELTRLR